MLQSQPRLDRPKSSISLQVVLAAPHEGPPSPQSYLKPSSSTFRPTSHPTSAASPKILLPPAHSTNTRSLAILFRGGSFRSKKAQATNEVNISPLLQMVTSETHQKHIIRPLRTAGWEVDIFLITYESRWSPLLLKVYAPVAHQFTGPCAGNAQICQGRHYHAGLELVRRHIARTQASYASVLMFRFDLKWKFNLLQSPGLKRSHLQKPGASDEHAFILAFRQGRVFTDQSHLGVNAKRHNRGADTYRPVRNFSHLRADKV